jgi:hypothetical protein
VHFGRVTPYTQDLLNGQRATKTGFLTSTQLRKEVVGYDEKLKLGLKLGLTELPAGCEAGGIFNSFHCNSSVGLPKDATAVTGVGIRLPPAARWMRRANDYCRVAHDISVAIIAWKNWTSCNAFQI